MDSRLRGVGIADSVDIFEQDTAKSAGERCRPALVKALTHNSGHSIDWLVDSFGLKLDTVSRMAAHTNPRTHRGSDGGQFPGMMITYGLVEKLEAISEADPARVQIVNKATVTNLLRDASGAVIGVECVSLRPTVGFLSPPPPAFDGSLSHCRLLSSTFRHSLTHTRAGTKRVARSTRSTARWCWRPEATVPTSRTTRFWPRSKSPGGPRPRRGLTSRNRSSRRFGRSPPPTGRTAPATGSSSH